VLVIYQVLLFTYYISGLEYDQRRTQDPTFVDRLNVRQRAYNTENNTFEQTQGQAFTIERLMPVPYTLRLTVDLWTTNYNQKLEIAEQSDTLFNPALKYKAPTISLTDTVERSLSRSNI